MCFGDLDRAGMRISLLGGVSSVPYLQNNLAKTRVLFFFCKRLYIISSDVSKLAQMKTPERSRTSRIGQFLDLSQKNHYFGRESAHTHTHTQTDPDTERRLQLTTDVGGNKRTKKKTVWQPFWTHLYNLQGRLVWITFCLYFTKNQSAIHCRSVIRPCESWLCY